MSETKPASIKHRIAYALSSFDAFIRDESIGSIFLFICTVSALVIANTPWWWVYQSLVETYAKIEIGEFSVEGTLHGWVNDGLMVLFFFVLGLEIKRELLVGELKDARLAFPVSLAALGGMIVPALIFYGINADTPEVHGWGIPMATDTAFAIGVLALVGRKAILGAAAFLTALAIIDDIGAIVVIAMFYSQDISLPHLLGAGLIFASLIGLNFVGVRRPGIYLFGGVVLWLVMLSSGVHATSAGILAALAAPARPRRLGAWLTHRVQRLMRDFEARERERPNEVTILADQAQHAVIEDIEAAVEQVTTPLQRWERALERPIALFVLPLFALMNAGVPLTGGVFTGLWSEPLAWGIILGLVVGKAIGITGGAWLALRAGYGRLPAAMDMRHIFGIGLLGGMGFTMSIFIAGLGLEPGSETLNTAKVAIISASVIAGLLGYSWLKWTIGRQPSRLEKSGQF